MSWILWARRPRTALAASVSAPLWSCSEACCSEQLVELLTPRRPQTSKPNLKLLPVLQLAYLPLGTGVRC